MDIDNKKIDAATKEFLENPYWKKVYEEATDAAKEWHRYTFLFSLADKYGVEPKEVSDALADLEKRLSFNDLTSILRWTTNGHMRDKIKKLMASKA